MTPSARRQRRVQRFHVSLLLDETGDLATVGHRSPGIRVQFAAGLAHFEVFFSAATQLQSSRLLIAIIGGSKRPRSTQSWAVSVDLNAVCSEAQPWPHAVAVLPRLDPAVTHAVVSLERPIALSPGSPWNARTEVRPPRECMPGRASRSE